MKKEPGEKSQLSENKIVDQDASGIYITSSNVEISNNRVTGISKNLYLLD